MCCHGQLRVGHYTRQAMSEDRTRCADRTCDKTNLRQNGKVVDNKQRSRNQTLQPASLEQSSGTRGECDDDTNTKQYNMSRHDVI